MTDICKAGAAASARVQKEKSKKKWEANRPKCLYCGAMWEWSDSVQGYYQRKRKFCNSLCAKKHFWTIKKSAADLAIQDDDLGWRQKQFVRREALTKHARRQYKKSGGVDYCENCGYSKLPPQIAHVDPVAGFSDTATLFEINDPSNLAGLGSRCHIEYDSGLIEKSEIQKLVARRLLHPEPQEVS